MTSCEELAINELVKLEEQYIKTSEALTEWAKELNKGKDSCKTMKAILRERQKTDNRITDSMIHHLPDHLTEEYKHDYEKSTPGQSEILNLAEKIESERLRKLLAQTNDTMPIIAQYDLDVDQILLLSDTEQEQYRDLREDKILHAKHGIHTIDSGFKSKMIECGLLSDDEENKESTKIPSKGFWGDSEYYRYNFMLGDYFDSLGKYFHDYAKTIYVFKPSPEINKEALALLQKWLENRGIPLSVMALIQAKDGMNILANIQDEKYRDSFLGWLKKSVHKFWDYGNHGTGEVDFVQTGEILYKLRLRTDEEIEQAKQEGRTLNKYCVLRVPIKRNFTREQIGDVTTVQIDEKQNQIFIPLPKWYCPNHFNVGCKKCGNEDGFYTYDFVDEKKVILDDDWDGNCNYAYRHINYNTPLIPRDNLEVFAGHFFYKAGCATLANDLSNSIEKFSESVLYTEKKTPIQFVNEQLKVLGIASTTLTPQDIDVEDVKPDKIKEINIDETTKGIEAYNVWYGRAHRTQLKAEYFSDKA